jgi:hypothetical protein
MNDIDSERVIRCTANNECPRCGKIDPAEIHTCTPKLEPVAYRYKENPEDLRSRWLYVAKKTHVPPRPCQPLYTAPPQQELLEPVLIVEKEPDYMSRGSFHEGTKPFIDPTKVWALPIGTKLYTAPPQRQPLTDEEDRKADSRPTLGRHGIAGSADVRPRHRAQARDRG